jgi:hypothetical protein
MEVIVPHPSETTEQLLSGKHGKQRDFDCNHTVPAETLEVRKVHEQLALGIQ